MKITSSRIVPAWICLWLLILAQAAGTVCGALYTETFDNATTGNLKTSDLSWSVYAGSTATNLSSVNDAGSPATTDYAGISPTDFIFVNNAITANQTFALVRTLPSSLTISSGNTFSWQMGNGSKTATAQLMIQVGGSWYVSTSVKQNSNNYGVGSDFITAVNASSSDVSFSLAFDPSVSAWKSVDLTAGSTLAIGSAIATPFNSSITITGVGFYMVDSGTGQSMRIDTLQIVPEPNALALVGLGGILLVFGARRQRR